MKIRVSFIKLKGKRHKVSTSEAACQRKNTRKSQIRAKKIKNIRAPKLSSDINEKNQHIFKDFWFLKKMRIDFCFVSRIRLAKS